MTKHATTLVSALAAILLIAVPAFAGGPLNLNPNESDNMERWPNGGVGIPFNIDLGDYIGAPLNRSNADGVAQLLAAFAEWESVATATNAYATSGPMPFDVDATNFNPFIQNLFFGSNVADGLSPIVFDPDGSIFLALFGVSGVLGFASPDTRDANGVPIEAVCFLNGGSVVGGFPEADFFGVVVHEIGHYTGLAHTVTNGQNIALGDASGPSPNNTFGNAPADQVETMYPFAIIGGGEATLHADEVNILSDLYPAASAATTLGTITGTVFGPDGVTPRTGVNVIAREMSSPFVDAASSISGDRGVPGVFTINVPPGEYTIHTDQILQGGFSTPPTTLAPSPEEFWNGAGESTDPTVDDPAAFVKITVAAGQTSTADIFMNGLAPGDLPLGDDDFIEVPLPFPFTICGLTFNSVFVNSNGSLTFGEGDADFTESAGEFLGGPPRIAALWDDLSPNNGGRVSFAASKNAFTVSFEDVPEFFNTGANSFDVTLTRASDHVIVDYGAVSAPDGLVGVTCGCEVASGSEPEIDVRTQPNLTSHNMNGLTAAYELFAFGENDVAGASIQWVNLDKPFVDPFEPNDSPGSATPIPTPFNSASVLTTISPQGGDVDYFAVDAAAGQTLKVEITNGCLDSLIGVFDAAGNLLAIDDDGGTGLLSFLLFEIPADGTYFIAVSTFPDFDFDGDGGSSGRYVLDVMLIDGILLDLGDDDFEEVDLGCTFPFQGTNYTSVFVNSNGNLTFGSGDADFSESVSELLNDQPRIAALWDDLSPNNGGQVIASRASGSFSVAFVDVPEFFSTGANNFTVTLTCADGSIDVAYGSVTANDGIAGVSPGGGASDPGESDLSSGGPFSATGVTYEQFTGLADPFDLDFLTVEFD
ncbi:MAG: hypothetical protein D6696_02975 [Acidobacteria bacterium]|nr:MAG: hypothetical protein D6696_02975 [Acidobacteriota bacterium]